MQPDDQGVGGGMPSSTPTGSVPPAQPTEPPMEPGAAEPQMPEAPPVVPPAPGTGEEPGTPGGIGSSV